MPKNNSNDGTWTWDENEKKKDLFKGKKAYVLPGAFRLQTISFLHSFGFEGVGSVKEADVVVFLGGADVNPRMYGEKPLPCVTWDNSRDASEAGAFALAREYDIPMFGICRGAQFLHVKNGGKLWQNVTNHTGSSHWIVDLSEDCRVLATSMHHQMLIPNEDTEIVAVCEDTVSDKFENESVSLSSDEDPLDPIEVEAAAYAKTKCFVVQGHPEVGLDTYQTWTMYNLYHYITQWEKKENSTAQTIAETTVEATKE